MPTDNAWTSEATWKAIQTSLDHADKMLTRAGDLLREEFRKLREAGQYRLPINPEMVQSCEKDWVIGLVNMYHDGQLTLPTLQKVLKKQDAEVRPLMGEADAKALTALIEQVDGQVMENMMQAVTKQMASAELHLQLARDARSFLSDYRQRVYDAYTMGLGKDYKEQWTGKYGHPQTEAGKPEWQFPSVPERRGGRKP